jgi:TP901 family phage tail tape measure protein
VAADNVVRIVVTSDNEASAGFDETTASAEAMAEKVSAAADEYTAAMNEAAEAQSRLMELQADSSASADELAAAQDKVTEATLASIDAQVKLGQAELEQSAASRDAGDAQEETAGKTDLAGESALGFGSKMKLAALGMAAGAAVSIKMAADWQESLTQLVTGAGEPVKAMAAIRQGILSLSVGTDTSVTDLTSGLYMISSAGYKGAEGLDILKAAAEGAKEGGASLADVANVLTSAMNAYHLPASAANSVTQQLMATVAAGKMHMQDLATSLSSVLPVAANAGISFSQVGGALATMTMQGMTARRASTDLGNMIRSLLKPSADASAEMKALGLNANQVSSRLGKVGLTGTLNELTEAILRNSKGGQALAASFAGMTPQTQAYARSILAGKLTTTQFTDAVNGLSTKQGALLTSFNKTATSATGVKTTFDGAMSSMVGGATGLNVALLLGGKNMGAFQSNAKSVADAAKTSGSNITNWAKVQGDFNFKLGQAGKAAEAVAYNLGDALLPAATKVMSVFASLGQWFAKNSAAGIALAAVIGGTLAMVIGGKLITSLSEAREAFSSLADSEMIQGAASKVAAAGQWLLNAAMDANPIMLIVIAIAALVAAIVLLTMHCKAFRDFWKDCWKVIEDAAMAAWHFIDDDMIHPLMDAIADLVDWIRSHWQLLATILATMLLGPIAGLVVFVATHWQQIRSLTSRLIDDVIHFFERLPGEIMSAIADLPGMLLRAGEHAIDSLIDGLGSGIGKIGSVMGGIASKIAGFIGLSPAREGPLSGGGSMYIRGLHIPQDVAMGISAGLPGLASAASRMAGTVGLGPGGRGYGGGSGGYTELRVTGAGSANFTALIKAIWPDLKLEVRTLGGGGPYSAQKALGGVWPRGA